MHLELLTVESLQVLQMSMSCVNCTHITKGKKQNNHVSLFIYFLLLLLSIRPDPHTTHFLRNKK